MNLKTTTQLSGVPYGSAHENDIKKSGKAISKTNKKVEALSCKSFIARKLHGIGKKISIFLRSICGFIVSVYYLRRYNLKITTDKDLHQLNDIIKQSGPAAAKLLRLDPSFNKEMEKLLLNELLQTTKEEKYLDNHSKKSLKNVSNLFHELLDKNITTKISDEKAQQVLNKNFGDKYRVGKYLGSGSIAACHEVITADNKTYVAKLVPTELKNKILNNIKFWKLIPSPLDALTFNKPLLRSELKSMQRREDALKTIKEECNLTAEHENHNKFRDAFMSLDTKSEIEFKGTKSISKEKVTLNWTVPKIVENKSCDDLLIMEKAEGYTLAELKRDPALFIRNFSKCFGYEPRMIKTEVRKSRNFITESKYKSDDEILFKKIKKAVNKKWGEILVKKNWAHGDLNDGNIIIQFNEHREINISIIDFGSSFEVEDEQIACLRRIAENIKYYLTEIPEEQRTSGIKEKYPAEKTMPGNYKGEILKKLQPNEANVVSGIVNIVCKYVLTNGVSVDKKEYLYRKTFYCLEELLSKRRFNSMTTYRLSNDEVVSQEDKSFFEFDPIKLTNLALSKILVCVADAKGYDTDHFSPLLNLINSERSQIDSEFLLPNTPRRFTYEVPFDPDQLGFTL